MSIMAVSSEMLAGRQRQGPEQPVRDVDRRRGAIDRGDPARIGDLCKDEDAIGRRSGAHAKVVRLELEDGYVVGTCRVGRAGQKQSGQVRRLGHAGALPPRAIGGRQLPIGSAAAHPSSERCSSKRRRRRC
jgi:hypothetical protein